MTYIVLHSTSTSENILETNALNNNYGIIDTQLAQFQQWNAALTTPTIANAEIGMEVFPSYSADIDGARNYASDGTTWHRSDHHETWSSWSNNYPLTSVAQTGDIWLRTSNFGRVECAMNMTYVNPETNKGVWQTIHDPSTAAKKILWSTFGFNNPAGAGTGIYMFEGCVIPNLQGDTTGHGEQFRVALDLVTVSSTNYMRVRACFTEVAASSSGAGTCVARTMYDSVTPYAGSIN